MKRIAEKVSGVSLSVVFGFLILVACTGVPTSNAVELPAELIAVLGMVVLTLITGALKWLGAKIGQDLSGQAAQLAAAVSSVIVLGINYWLALVPAAYDNLISAIFSGLIVWLGGMGVYSLWKTTVKNARG